MKDTLPQKHIVTGYFHTHAYGLTREQKKQYKKALRGHTTLALEALGYRPEDNQKLNQWVSIGKIPRRSDLPIKKQHVAEDVYYRLREAVKSPIQEAFYADSAFRQSRRADQKFREIENTRSLIVAVFINGDIRTLKEYQYMLQLWNDLSLGEALLHRRREEHMIGVIKQKVKNTPASRKVLFQAGAFHIGGLNQLLRNDPQIEFQTIVEKPLVLGFQEGLLLSQRLGRKPSIKLVSKGLFESAVYTGLQIQDSVGRSKSNHYKNKLLAKNIAAILTSEEIQNIFISDKERSIQQFMEEVNVKVASVRGNTKRRQMSR